MSNPVQVWPDGSTFLYQATVINGAGGGGDVSVALRPLPGNEFELYYGTVSHNDATASDVDVEIRDAAGGNLLVNLYDVDAVTQNSLCQFPPGGTAPSTTGNAAPQLTRPIMLSSNMELFIEVLAIDASEGITVSIVGRIIGGVPTITETGNSTPTITINTEKTV